MTDVPITARLPLKPLRTPNFVRLASGRDGEGPCFALHELDAETVDALLERFAADFRAKAAKPPA